MIVFVVVTISATQAEKKEDYHLWRLFNQAYRIAIHVLSVIKFFFRSIRKKIYESYKYKGYIVLSIRRETSEIA